MAIVESHTWLEYLSPAECWRLLAEQPAGRIGVLVNSAPEIYPVNYLVDGQQIVFRTDHGSKLSGLNRSPSVCFEVDGINVDDRSGWSVLVKGRAAEVSDTDELRVVQCLPLHHWALGPKTHWVRITPHEITGRRIHSIGDC